MVYSRSPGREIFIDPIAESRKPGEVVADSRLAIQTKPGTADFPGMMVWKGQGITGEVAKGIKESFEKRFQGRIGRSILTPRIVDLLGQLMVGRSLFSSLPARRSGQNRTRCTDDR